MTSLVYVKVDDDVTYPLMTWGYTTLLQNPNHSNIAHFQGIMKRLLYQEKRLREKLNTLSTSTVLAMFFSFVFFLLALSHINAVVAHPGKSASRSGTPVGTNDVNVHVQYPQNISARLGTLAVVFSSSMIIEFDDTDSFTWVSQIYAVPVNPGCPENIATRGGTRVGGITDYAHVHFPQTASARAGTLAEAFSSVTNLDFNDTDCSACVHQIQAISALLGHPRNDAARGGTPIRANDVLVPVNCPRNTSTRGDTLLAVFSSLTSLNFDETDHSAWVIQIDTVPMQSRYPRNTAARGVTAVAVCSPSTSLSFDGAKLYTWTSTPGALVLSSSWTFNGHTLERSVLPRALYGCNMWVQAGYVNQRAGDSISP
ncbi:hypothetical protein BJ138DRAFT_1107414 [Hygrophoropsis aurantiaca]|uniref:Uncharacterized protein n=1 Tax=Hygrophoropsis aurantiaca TaxID=72124 RepID=A0ACB7ZSC5_9AGAM|nr:hypothetical protein BJ138DRAFT_1107414 [Hygrophoropsis aurantiaca]